MEEEFRNNLTIAVRSFSEYFSDICRLSKSRHGLNGPKRVEKEFQALRVARQHYLDKPANPNANQQLLKAANTEALQLAESIDQMNDINGMMKHVTTIVEILSKLQSVD